VDITGALRDVFAKDLFLFCFVSFRFEANEDLQRCGDGLFDILIKSNGPSALDMFRKLNTVESRFTNLQCKGNGNWFENSESSRNGR